MRSVVTPRLTLLTLGHFTIDSYSSFFSPLLPLLVGRLHLSLTDVGLLVALASLASSFSQPLFGLWSDRMRRPWLVAVGPLIAAVVMSSVGLAPNYAALIGMLMLGGLGVAAFHPQAAALARESSPRPGLAMSTFVTGGTLGFALGPLIAVSVAGWVGLERTWIAAFPGLIMGGALAASLLRDPAMHTHTRARPALRELRPVLGPLTVLYFTVVCRSAVASGFMTFLPLYLHGRGFSVQAGGAITTAFLALGASGGFVGGWLAEHWGGRRVVVTSFLCALPLFAGFLLLPDRFGLPSLILGSFALQTSLPVNVVMGQELSPRHASTISSLLMGAAWGLGALIIGPIGAIADHTSLHVGLACLSALLVAGFACASALPDIRRGTHVPLVQSAGPAVEPPAVRG